MPSTRPLLFISYATPDRERVLPYHDWLQTEGYETWIDCNQLLPGQNWDLEINPAIDRATLILAFVSENTIARRGYVQRELKIALDRLRDRLSDDIYIIPILLQVACRYLMTSSVFRPFRATNQTVGRRSLQRFNFNSNALATRCRRRKPKRRSRGPVPCARRVGTVYLDIASNWSFSTFRRASIQAFKRVLGAHSRSNRQCSI